MKSEDTKAVKIIVAVLLSIVLLITSGLALATFAINDAISDEAIKEAVVQASAVDQLTDEILEENALNIDGELGDAMQSILKSNSMTEFFSVYTSNCVQGMIYEEEYEEVGADELNIAFQNSIDECIANGSISMNDYERKVLDIALDYSMPMLADGINSVLQEMDLNSYVDSDTAKNIEYMQRLVQPQVRIVAIIESAVICLILILLFWRSKLGFIWCGVVFLIVALIFGIIVMTLEGAAQSSDSYIDLSTRMLYVMISFGLKKVAIVGCVAGAVTIPICPLLRVSFR